MDASVKQRSRPPANSPPTQGQLSTPHRQITCSKGDGQNHGSGHSRRPWLRTSGDSTAGRRKTHRVSDVTCSLVLYRSTFSRRQRRSGGRPTAAPSSIRYRHPRADAPPGRAIRSTAPDLRRRARLGNSIGPSGRTLPPPASSRPRAAGNALLSWRRPIRLPRPAAHSPRCSHAASLRCRGP